MPKRIVVIACVAAISLAAPLTAAQAAITPSHPKVFTYSLTDFRLIEGGSASGTITFNTDYIPQANIGGAGSAFIDYFNITVDAGSGRGYHKQSFNYPSFNYRNNNSYAQSIYITSPTTSRMYLTFIDNSLNRVLAFNMLVNSSEVGKLSNIPIDFSDKLRNVDCLYSCGVRIITSGSLKLVNSAVPEPATWGMMIAGVGIAGATLRRRHKSDTLKFA